MFAKVVFPLPFRRAFTYSIPAQFENAVKIGVRVVASFGRRTMTGFVVDIVDQAEKDIEIKPLRDVLDDEPIFDKESLKFYEWVADYYMSSLGEALKNTVPYGTDIESKKKIVSDTEICAELFAKEKKGSLKAKLLGALAEKNVYTIVQLQKIVKKKSIYHALKSLEKEGAVSIIDELEDAKVGVKKLKFVKLAKPADKIFEFIGEVESKAPKQAIILMDLISRKEEVQLSEVISKTKSSYGTVSALEKKGFVKIFEKEISRYYEEEYSEGKKSFKLTAAQLNIINSVSEKITKKKFESFLLHGVTGSGKTQVYIELAKQAIKSGRNVIILVPEISLTPQITTRFFEYLGNTVAVFHSRMSLGERYDTWRGIRDGKFRVVIGPRSALFAPLANIGLIVVDEEHDSSYKQWDLVPRYQARDSAVIKAMYSNCPVVLGSATPSLESMYNAETGKYKLLELPERVDNAKLPIIKLIDIKKEKSGRKSEYVFSKFLLEEINKRVLAKEGVIILQNRRGFSTQIFCEDCGEVVMCDDCAVPMVYHISNNLIQCHYCNTVKTSPKGCPNCGSVKLKYFGTGTQKVEDELEFYFPEIKIERIDSDSINKKGALSRILNDFRKGEVDVLVGTQMVSKGLDFPHVTLVGVISAEATLWMPDFRADERTFQLLTQVSGRAGRSAAPGEVIIQTADPTNFVLREVFMNDYQSFYKREMGLRKQHGYPPFSRLALIEFKDENESDARGAAMDLFRQLKRYEKYIEINDPAPAIIPRIKGQFRFHILLKSFKEKDPSGKILRQAINESSLEFNKFSRFKKVRILFDIDPAGMM